MIRFMGEKMTNPNIQKAQEFFDSDKYLSEFYESALKSFNDKSNPLRLCNFACNIRELLREKLSRDAPDEDVINCSWCNEKYLDNDGKPTRKARLRYFLLFSMDNETVYERFQEKITDIEKEYGEQINKLSKYTHVTKKVFYMSEHEKDNQFNEVIDLLAYIIDFLAASEKLTYREIESFLYDDISNHVYNDCLDSELDVLSTHTRVEDVNRIEFSIKDIDKDYIYIEGTASLDTCLQYGSFSEMRRGDGASFDMTFDLDFSVKIDISDLNEKEYKYEPVNTDKFYE